MRKSYLFIVTAIALIFCISLTNYLPSYAFGPVVVQTVTNGSGNPSVGLIQVTISNVVAGDDIVIGATNNVRSGSASGFTITGVGLVCQNLVKDTSDGGDNSIAVSVCPNASAGGHLITATETGNACPASGCGFMGVWAYELQGTGFVYTNSSGMNFVNNAGASTSPHTNSLSIPSPSLAIAFDSQALATTQTAGTGFALGTCYTSSISNAMFACTETQSFVSGSTTLPFTLNSNSNWMDEGVVITGGQAATTTFLTTLTVTAWNTIDPGTPTTWITLVLFLTLVPGFMWGMLRAFKARPSSVVFFTLLAAFIGALIGTISGTDLGVNAVVPLGITVFNGIALGLYVILSRQRGNPVT